MSLRNLAIAGFFAVAASWTEGTFLADEIPAAKKPLASEALDKKASAQAAKALKHYHTSAVQAFSETPGFGRERVQPMLKRIEHIYVDWSSDDVNNESSAVVVPDLAKAHRDRIGLLTREPMLSRRLPGTTVAPVHKDGIKQTWRLRRIDLVAVVDHETPVVYVTPKTQPLEPPNGLHDQTPASKQKSRSSREPDYFELAALDRFRDGEELFVRTKADTLRMVGALRAAKQCLECHPTAKEGDLFGAFSYTLTRVAR
jgi:Protein of unknown function (DUF3365)